MIAADRSGVENGIATMGTSLTEEHVSLLKKNVQSIIICYDSDSAGIEAAFRASNMLNESRCQVKVAIMPDGMDPDEYVKEYGEEKFRTDIIQGSMTLMSFKMLYYRKGKNMQNEGDRLRYIEQILKEISRLEKAVEKDLYLRQLADEFDTFAGSVKGTGKAICKGIENQKQQPPMPLNIPKQVVRVKPAYQNAERFLIAHMLHDVDLTYKVQELMGGNSFNIDEHQAIITYLYGFYESGHDPDVSAFLSYVEDQKLRRIVVEIGMISIKEEISEQELFDYINQVLKHQKMLKIKEKETELKDAERQHDFNRAKALLAEIIQLRKTL